MSLWDVDAHEELEGHNKNNWQAWQAHELTDPACSTPTLLNLQIDLDPTCMLPVLPKTSAV